MSALAIRRSSHPDRVGGAIVVAGLAAFVGVVYLVVVLGGGALIGHTSSPDTRLSILATLVVALGLNPVQARLHRLSRRVVSGERRRPYDVLSRFASSVTQSHDDDVPVTMARVLAEGTCAAWAQVWLLVGHEPVLAAAWPEHAGDAPYRPVADGQHARPVQLNGEALGEIRIQKRPDQSLTPVERQLFDELATQAGLVLHGTRLRTELARRHEELLRRADELRASRARIVETQDAERRRLERDIHDGAQQHLVALAVNLRLAQSLAATSPEAGATVLAAQVAATDLAIATLVDLSRGIYPGTLSECGIGPALRTATTSTTVPVEIQDGTTGRLRPDVELAVYFCCLEAVQNALKHAAASRVRVTLDENDAALVVVVADDGSGFPVDGTRDGVGLSNMHDRLDAVGGRLTIHASSAGTVVTARLPLDGDPA
jgi:signal transduction histidine kinase